MKKIIALVFLLYFVGCTYIGPGSKRLTSFYLSAQEQLGQNEKIMYAFTGSAKIILANAGFREKSGYGILTGILFSLSGFRDIYLSVRKEVE